MSLPLSTTRHSLFYIIITGLFIGIYLFVGVDSIEANGISGNNKTQSNTDYYNQIKKDCWYKGCTYQIDYMMAKGIKRAKNDSCSSEFQKYEVQDSKNSQTKKPIIMCIPYKRLISGSDISRKDFGDGFTLEQDTYITQLAYKGIIIKTWSNEAGYMIPGYFEHGFECPAITRKGKEKPELYSTRSIWDELSRKEKQECIRKAFSEKIIKITPVKNNKSYYTISENHWYDYSRHIFSTQQFRMHDLGEVFDVEEIIEIPNKFIIVNIPYYTLNSDTNGKILVYDAKFKSLITGWPNNGINPTTKDIRITMYDSYKTDDIYKINLISIKGKILQIQAQPFNQSLRNGLGEFDTETLYTINLP